MSAAEDFKSKLRRMRREDVAGPEHEAPERGGLPDTLRRRFERELAAGEDPELDVALGEDVSAGDPRDLRADMRVEGPVFYRETPFHESDTHGDWALAAVDGVAHEDLVLLTGDEALGELDLRNALYLDTETSGLSGGAGTYVFQVGLGCFGDGDFRVWQGFLTSPEGERALLAETAERIRAASGVVSFFGKSFDRHRLEDKMRMYGIDPPFPDKPHLDLYHPLRRLYGAELENGRLKTMESTLCALVREDDLPGALAPAAWFDYLAGRAHRLEGVFRHNLFDVLSLVTLTAHLGRSTCEVCLDGRSLSGPELARAAAIARTLTDAGRRGEALPWFQQALERARERGDDVSRALLFSYAEVLRLEREDQRAIELFEELARGAEDLMSARALVGLAKIREHRLKDRDAARVAAERALGALEASIVGDRALRRDLEKRLARLRRP